jgi:hypothetical protein
MRYRSFRTVIIDKRGGRLNVRRERGAAVGKLADPVIQVTETFLQHAEDTLVPGRPGTVHLD